MNKFNIDNFINSQKNSSNIDLTNMPNLDLYMDQVIQLFESHLEYTKRNDKDKVLTKTMINNYAKDHLLMKIKNKKYTHNHLILIGLIYNLKGCLSLTDIKTLLTPIVSEFDNGNNEYPLSDIYKSFLEIYDLNIDSVKASAHDIEKNALSIIEKHNSTLNEYDKQLLLVCAYISISNLFRRMSEKIIDECFNDNE